MAINVVVRKLLWGRAGNQCAMPDCLQSLTVDLATEEEGILVAAGAVVGEEAHIRSSQLAGPRHDINYPIDRLDSYDNLLLLCPTHHSIVDKNNGVQFSVADLVKIKLTHEERVARSLGPDGLRKREIEERMVALVLLWEQKIDLDSWHIISGQLNMPIPVMATTHSRLLNETAIWLFTKKWPKAFPQTVDAFRNLDTALGDLIAHFNLCMEPRNENRWDLERPYKRLQRWDSAEYDRLFTITQQHRFVLYSLVIEITKALNYVIDCVIEEVDPLYRFDTGAVLMRQGDGIIQADLLRVEYTPTEIEQGYLYPGVDSIVEQVRNMIATDVRNYDSSVMFHLNAPTVNGE
ncbi:hypothetical protein PV350_31445 [Streptomyces sp. PA03-6a]|nr:hypothetical protein [Streptomyces sp. PA03-6a]